MPTLHTTKILGDLRVTGLTNLYEVGAYTLTGQMTSTVATGTAPFVIASTTAVSNLNADLLDGNHASAFYLASNPSGYTTNTGTVTSITAGTGMNFTTITGTGAVTMGTPSSLTEATTNSVSGTTHTHAITNYALSGTTNQITVTGAGRVLGAATTLSLPQNIHTTATPTFARMFLHQLMTNGTTAPFTNPHLALTTPDNIDNTGFVGMTFATSNITNYGYSVGALRSTNGGGDFVIRSHNNNATGTEIFRLDMNGNMTIPGKMIVSETEVSSTSNGVLFEGSVADDNELLLKAGTLTADRTITLPNADGTVALTSDLHTRSHTMTSTSDHAAGNWKTFYSNGSGQVIELALGTAGHYLRAGGAAAAPTFAQIAYSEISGTPTIPTGFSISAGATDGIFDITGTGGTNSVSYAVAPYTAKTVGGFDSGVVNPDGTTRLNWNGNLYATNLYSGGNIVYTSANLPTYPTVNDASLTLTTSAGATNTAVTIGTGTGFTANDSTNTTYDIDIGPALTNLATTMTGATSGFLKKTSQDTYSLDSNTYLTAHPSVSAASSVNNSGRTYIQDITLDSFGHVTGLVSATESVTDTHYTAANFIGATGTQTNAATANGATYLKLVENSTIRSSHLITGAGATTVSSDANGNITISSTDTNTVYTHPDQALTQAAGIETTLADITLIDSLTTNATGHLTNATWRKLVAGSNVTITPAADGNITIASSFTDTNTATATDNILDGSNSGTAITYAPYSTNLAATGNRLYTTTDVPTATDRLNLSSYFWATRIHSLGIYGGNLASGNLTIGSTSHTTKGSVSIDSNTAIAGSVTVGSATVNGTNSGTMQYNATTKSIEFIFA